MEALNIKYTPNATILLGLYSLRDDGFKCAVRFMGCLRVSSQFFGMRCIALRRDASKKCHLLDAVYCAGSEEQLEVRSPASFAPTYVPHAECLPENMLGSYCPWFWWPDDVCICCCQEH